MSPKIRFTITVVRQVLAIVDLVIFPPERQRRFRRGSYRPLMVARFIALFLSVLRVVQAWRELRRGEAGPERKRARKPRHARPRHRTRGKKRE